MPGERHGKFRRQRDVGAEAAGSEHDNVRATLTDVTPRADCDNSPAHSMPSGGGPGGRPGYRLRAFITSLKFMAAAWTAISTSPGPGGRR